jgi:Protein of unknown function (DUF3567)
MQMLYNSDSFVVVHFDLSANGDEGPQDGATPGRGGYEIVDKFARKEIFIMGALAEKFQLGAKALAEQEHTAEQMDDFIAGFTEMAQHPLTLH